MRTLTKRLAIEPLTLAHADELIGLTDPLVNAHFPAGDAPTDLHMLRSQFEAMLAGPAQPRPGERFLNHAVRRIDNGQCIGRLEAFAHGNAERDAEIAFLFVPESWGFGYASEAVQWLLNHVAAEHDVLRFWACVTPSNQRSLALLHRLGFSVTAQDQRPTLASHEDGDVVFMQQFSPARSYATCNNHLPSGSLPMTDTPWTARPTHRDWLMGKANALFDLFQHNAVNPKGGFFDLDAAGNPYGNLRQIHATARMVHCFAIGEKLGRPGSATIVDHGMRFLWEGHRDQKYGGYCWSLDDDGYKDDSKQAYGHAFVLLAASDAKVMGHPLADAMLADITEVLETRFWEEQHGAVSEEYARDWSKITDYRGQNSNMHLTEALMAAFEATGDASYLDKAKRIASLIIGRHAASLDYVVAEHFDSSWTIDKAYKGSDMFRPAGTTPGHWLEWSRLMAQLWVLDGKKEAWHIEAAHKLFRSAVTRGWDKEKGGFWYTLDFDNRPALTHKIWWPATEAIGAAAFLAALKPDPFLEAWYRKVWDFSGTYFIDPANGGWYGELGDDLKPINKFFTGKPDIYHALQACLIPLSPATGSLMRAIEG